MRKKQIAFLAIFAFIATLAATMQPARAQAPETYFPYPAVPDSMKTLQQRCDYLVNHFWDFCDLKKSFSSHPKMEQSLADYLSFMPHASRDSVMTSLGRFFKKLDKQPADLLFIAECAESQLMGDSAQFVSEELYLEFAKAVVANKRIDRTAKARYQHQVDVLGATQPGLKTPALKATDRFGNPATLEADTADVVLLFFSDPTCDDCKTARVRLDANIKANILINHGIMKVVCVTTDEFSPEWQEMVKDYPLTWHVVAAPDADMIYDIAAYPSFYILDDQQKIVAKNFNINQVLQVIDRL